MSAELSHEEATLLRELAAVRFRAESVPDDVIGQARDAFAWRDVAAVIASLEYDSLLDDDDLARVRSAHDERILVFGVGDVTVRLSVLDAGRRLVGQLTPADYTSVELRQRGRSTGAEVDETGRFLVETMISGAVSLRCAPARGHDPVLETEWVTI